ncbi:MAG: DUF4856 domain-containing protein [Gemmatimonadota bacterium]|nr:DUF4856 domain-containing protein [Gemmatimonadota bacterium]
MRIACLSVLLFTACTGESPEDTGDGKLVDTGDTADTADTADTNDSGDTGSLPDRYAFTGRTGAESVSTEGQIFRHLLIVDMKSHLGELTDRLNNGHFPQEGDVARELDFYFSFDSESSGSVEHLFSSTPAPVQTTYDELATGKNLVGKIAGNDAAGQHEDWSTALVGWEHPDVSTPESLVLHWFAEIDAAAQGWANGEIPLDPSGAPVSAVYVTADGLNLRELLQKFLTGAVAFSQGADDYLDDDLAGSGLLSSHANVEEGKPYTALEHAWDEGFGYFGASRDYCSGDDAVIASPGYADTVVADGAIDLLTEVCWGHSTNAAKRDAGAIVPTDFTADAWAGFLGGRALLASTTTDLSADELASLQAFRDQAVLAWERAIAASVVHYINGVVVQMDAMGTETYSFDDHAKKWSEMKGFALVFQFNPRSPLTDEQFVALHDLLGTRPVLATAGAETISDYQADLLAARAMIGTAYGFDAANLGGDDGTGGW